MKHKIAFLNKKNQPKSCSTKFVEFALIFHNQIRISNDLY